MPELPEVEITARSIAPLVIGRTVTAYKNRWRNSLKARPIDMKKFLVGAAFTGVSRRGKYLQLSLDNTFTLIIHLKMSGRLMVLDSHSYDPKHIHHSFSLSDGKDLVFRDPRKFGRVYLVSDPTQVTGKLGPEPLAAGFTLKKFRQILAGRKGILKAFLLNQERIAGLGNIYVDESCFRAGILPTRLVNTLAEAEQSLLFTSIKAALRHGIVTKGADLGDNVYRGGGFQNHFQVYGRTGQPCRQCSTPIERQVVAARSTHYCPQCQR